MKEVNSAKIPRTCLLKIHAIYDTLKQAEKKAVDYILDKPQLIGGVTIMDFAREAGCSGATVVRISKRLGYSGFQGLKRAFSDGDESAAEEAFDYEGISLNDGSIEVVEKVIDSTIAALKDTYNIMNKEEYMKAVDALCKAQKIAFCGVGDAALVAMEACQRFIRIGEHSMTSEDPDLQLIISSQLDKGDVLVAISHSGRSRTVVNTVKRAKKAGATVIAVTNFPVTQLTKNADITLLTAVFSRHVTGEVISKRVAELCLLESLYINFMIRKGKPVLHQLEVSNDSIRLNKLR